MWELEGRRTLLPYNMTRTDTTAGLLWQWKMSLFQKKTNAQTYCLLPNSLLSLCPMKGQPKTLDVERKEENINFDIQAPDLYITFYQ